MKRTYDYVVIGAGIYGLYATQQLIQKKRSVCVLEREPSAFTQASYVNQARVHNGYHYPRSVATARATAEYFDRFAHEYAFAMQSEFTKIYAISKAFSYTSADDFKKFCKEVGIPCEEVSTDGLFNPGVIESAFKTREYSFDAEKIKNFFLKEIGENPLAEIRYNSSIQKVENNGSNYLLTLQNGDVLETKNVINATYANINEVIALFGHEPFPLKYEYCEIALCKVSPSLSKLGITVMDGPFFSLMPFGLTGLHSLSAVSYTPIKASSKTPPSPTNESQWASMSQLARKYLHPSHTYSHEKSLFTTKTIFNTTELSDSRPTVIRKHTSTGPNFTSVMSGKINCIFDLDEILP